MKFFRNGYWQKLLIFLTLFIQFAIVLALLIILIDVVSLQGELVLIYFIAGAFAAGLICAVHIFSTSTPDVYKLSWLFLVLTIPVGGVLLYVFFANKTTNWKQRKMLNRFRRPIEHEPMPEAVEKALTAHNPEAASIAGYLELKSGGGPHQRTSVKFFPIVDDAFEPILEELRKAKHYVFLEFFIVSHGKMWDTMLEILKEKAAAGVDVRLIYDDVGSLGTLPMNYPKELEGYGIRAVKFNPFRAFLDIRMNNRDHRKILVIDGHTCFSGGFNIADEYINAEVRFGHWKDNAILIKGEGVANFTNMFLATWIAVTRDENEFANLAKNKRELYAPSVYIDEAGGFPKNDGFVQPYGDLPFDAEAVGERVYLDLINDAREYLYMTTPYLIIDNDVKNALIHAAHRGVDVRLLTPHIPDKPTVFSLTRSFYGPLMKAGVKVYEYTPGFVHEKTFICDGRMATVGTINLDYRSLYLHLECGTFMVGCSCIKDMEKDYLETLERSHRVTYEQWERWQSRQYWYWAVLRIIGPFL